MALWVQFRVEYWMPRILCVGFGAATIVLGFGISGGGHHVDLASLEPRSGLSGLTLFAVALGTAIVD